MLKKNKKTIIWIVAIGAVFLFLCFKNKKNLTGKSDETGRDFDSTEKKPAKPIITGADVTQSNTATIGKSLA